MSDTFEVLRSVGVFRMRVYWRKVKWGQDLILGNDDDGHEEKLGGFRDTNRGIDALAKTFSYDPSRSRKGFATTEEAKAFVESFSPWELFGAKGVTVDTEVRIELDSAERDTIITPDHPTALIASDDLLPTKEWWQFWKKS